MGRFLGRFASLYAAGAPAAKLTNRMCFFRSSISLIGRGALNTPGMNFAEEEEEEEDEEGEGGWAAKPDSVQDDSKPTVKFKRFVRSNAGSGASGTVVRAPISYVS